jgi:YD repeat-containing protein
MKHILLLFIAFSAYVTAPGQSVSFRYDKSGNRTSRTSTINLKSTFPIEDKTKIVEPLTDKVGEHGIMIYPNPVTTELTVEIQGMDENIDASISIIDQAGRLVVNQIKATGNNLIDLSHLSPGNYFMVIRVGSQNTKWNIVKEQ